MHSQHAQREHGRPSDPVPSPFRAAFSRARVESLAAGVAPVQDERAPKQSGRKKEKRVKGVQPSAPPLHVYEYRIDRRSGKRSVDVVAWNKLGLDGWELVSVTSKHAHFKRERAVR